MGGRPAPLSAFNTGDVWGASLEREKGMGVDLGDLRSIRKALDISQGRMAALLGVSTRAIQSYEQGWRTPPATALKLAAYMLYVRRRSRLASPPAPCWDVHQCDPAQRADCFAFTSGEGKCCWLVTGNSCGKQTYNTWKAKLAHCCGCEVVRRWLNAPQPAAGKGARATPPAAKAARRAADADQAPGPPPA